MYHLGQVLMIHYKKRGNLLNKEDVIKSKNEAIKMMTDYLDNCLAIDDRLQDNGFKVSYHCSIRFSLHVSAYYKI